MKTKLVILLVALATWSSVCVTNIVAKTYLKGDDSWTVAQLYTNKGGTFYINYNYTLKGDTVINSKAYKPVFVTQDSVFVANKATKDFFIREDNGRWFYTVSHLMKEVLLYDFNLHAGDTVTVRNFEWPYVILKVDSILLHNEWRKRFYVTWYSSTNSNTVPFDYWIEGIGSSHGLFHDYYITSDQSILLCYQQNGELFYQNSVYNRCAYPTSIETPRIALPIRISKVSTAKGNYKVQSEEEIEFISVSDIQGRVWQQVRPYDHAAYISLATRPKGVYVFRVVTARGNYFQKVINQ